MIDSENGPLAGRGRRPSFFDDASGSCRRLHTSADDESKFWGLILSSSRCTRVRRRDWRVLLSGLGFEHVGEHRSKDVSLWRQGDVHLVINRDAVGWAHAHWQIHGASVCAIALRVDDTHATLARAQALNMETFQQKVAEGELAIPWIRGVGGALTYFTEPDRGHGPLDA